MTTIETSDAKRVLELLAQGKINVDEAQQLLAAMKEGGPPSAAPAPPRWMRISLHKAARDGRPEKNVSIRVPMALARSGIKLGAMLPHIAGPRINDELRKEGINLDVSKIDFSQIEAALADLGETTIVVDEGTATVRITCE